MEWIKWDVTSEPKDKFVLALNKEMEMAVIWKSDGYWIKGGWFGFCEYGCGGYDHFEDISHWMPLPKPPK